MQKVLQFLLQRINFILFLLLEVISFILLFSNNAYQGTSFFSSSNEMAASMANFSYSVKEYINLKDVNLQLAEENKQLRNLISQKNIKSEISFNDSSYAKKYKFSVAKVINNSTDKFHNFLTINKGTNDSLTPGMGVISPKGIVGKIKSCSKNFSTVTSILHKGMMISSKIKRTGTGGTVVWDGSDPTIAILKYVPRHIEIKKGDLIVASEYNSVFPEGEPIGKILSFSNKGDDNFHSIKVKLSTDFFSLGYVYVIKNRLKIQQDSLEAITQQSSENK